MITYVVPPTLTEQDLANIEVAANKLVGHHTHPTDTLALVAEVRRLRAEIGKPPHGSHPDEAKPRAGTWHTERLCWQSEVESLRLAYQQFATQFVRYYRSDIGSPDEYEAATRLLNLSGIIHQRGSASAAPAGEPAAQGYDLGGEG